MSDDKILIGLTTTKEENMMNWYRQVVQKSQLIMYSNVGGCYVMLPNSYALWEKIQEFLNGRFKNMGVQNAYFPMFVTKDNIEKEKNHLEGFNAELLWVTRCGESELGVPLGIRPTSECIIYPAYSELIKSHRDLPLKMNQWCSVVRWESKDCVPFLRQKQFNWSECHTAFNTKSEAKAEVIKALDLYTSIYQDLMAIPVIKGRKSEKEKFAGADFTTTTEVVIPLSGKSIQASTAHHLGQNFSKMFNIQVEKPDGTKQFVYQNSWGISTRSLGVLTLVHGDNKGLVLPPRITPMHVIIIPCGLNSKTTPEMRKSVMDMCDEMQNVLQSCSGLKNVHDKIAHPDLHYKIRAEVDSRPKYSPGHKYNYWEMRGACLRLEIGPKDIESKSVVVCRRDTGEKLRVKYDFGPHDDLHCGAKRVEFWREIQVILDSMQTDMFNKALAERNAHIKVCNDMAAFDAVYNQGSHLMLVPWCESTNCEEDIVEKTREQGRSIKSLCIPFDQNMPIELTGDESNTITQHSKCLWCDKAAKSYTLFGSSF